MTTRLLRFALLGAAAIPFLYSQSDTGRIVGTVTDTTNAVVQHAAITIKNEKTGQTRTTTSNDQGVYQVTQLGPSEYTITAEVAGMAPAEYKAVALEVGQERRVNITVQPAGIATEVSVSGGNLVVIDTSSAAMGGNVSSREVSELPINGRQISQLYLMTPGAVNFGPGTYDDVRFNGRSFEQNALRFDGIEAGGIVTNNPSNIGGEINSVFRLQASMENVQEFRVDASNYPAEFGTGSGGQISIITKSGSNAFHGGVFEYFRNDALDARNEFDGAQPSTLRLNQFGGSVGGPILKDKLFFFGGVEAMAQRTAVPFVENTLSRAVRAAPDCAGGQTPSATAVTCINPNMRPLISAFPLGISATSSPFFDRDNVREPGTIDEYSGNVRFDYQATDKDRIYLRYNRDQGYGILPLNSAGSGTQETIVPENAVLAYNRVISPTVVNEAKFGFNGSKTRVSGLAPVAPGVNLDGLSLSLNGVQTLDGTPGYALPSGLLRISTAFNGKSAPYTNYSLSFIDSLSWIHGNHSFKAGVEIRPLRIENAILGGITYTFPSVQGFLADTPSQVAINGNTNDVSPWTGKGGYFHMGQTFYIGYLQDEWKIRPNLTLSYGLRYEYYSPLHEDNNKVLWFDVPTGTLIPNYTGNWYTMKKTNFGPRLGLSWSPDKAANKTVFRVGSGYYYGPGLGEGQVQPPQNDRINRTITSGSLMTFPADIPTILSTGINDPNLQFQPRAYLPGYAIPEKILQYSASVQQTLPGDAVLTVAYVGSQGRNLFLRGITNRINGFVENPTTGAATITREFSVVNGLTVTNRFAEIDTKTSGGNDHYNGLQIVLNRHFSKGLTFGTQYVWSHSNGNTDGSKDARSSENNYSFSSEYGDNISDVRQSINLNMLYALPYGRDTKNGAHASGLMQTLFGRWQFGTMFNARTGLPIDVEIARNSTVVYRNNVTGVITTSPVVGSDGTIMTTPIVNVPGGGQSRNVQRPNLVPGVDPYLHNQGWLYLNPAAFSMPAPGTYGNLGRDALRGPSISQVDLTLSKKFTLTEMANIEFRAECFNVFNSPVYQVPNYATVSGSQVRLADGQSVLQPGQPYTASAAGGGWGALTQTVSNTVGSGTSRQFQLALRVSF
jgi:Carboxypeptidase regulatory-like domain/TonB dependent receptor